MDKTGTLEKICGKSGHYLKHHSSTILTCIGAVGVIVTSVIAVKSTPKAIKLLQNAEQEKGEGLTKLEVIKTAYKEYIPAAVIGIATISCIFGANILNKRQQAAITSAYAMLNQSYQQYRKAANIVYGENANSSIQAQMAKDTYISADGYSVYDSELDKESEKVLCYDLFSQRYFTATMAAVLNAQYHINRNLCLRGDASINEFYEFLGIDKIPYGDAIGWDMCTLMEDEILWLDFENSNTVMEDGMECCVISALWAPTKFDLEN